MNSLTLVSNQILNYLISLWNSLSSGWGILGTGILGFALIRLVLVVIRSFNKHS